MLRKFLAAALIGLLSSQPANAFLHRGAVVSLPAVGNAQINLGNGELSGAQEFINIFNSTGIQLTGSPAPTADVLDSNSFPIANFSGGFIGGQISQQSGTVLSTTGPYTFGWDASRSCFDIAFTKTPGVASVLTGTGITIINGSGVGNLEIRGNCGQAGSITVTWNDATGQKSWGWVNTYTLWSSNTPDTGRMWMCRSANVGWNGLDDCTAYQAGIIWTTEFVNLIRGLKPQALRTMGWNLEGPGQSSLATLWKYRGSVNRFSMSSGGAFPISMRAGGGPSAGAITGTNGAYTSPAATDTDLSGWNTNGEWIMGNVQTASGGLLVSGIVPGTGSNCQVSVLSFSFTGTTHGTTTIDGITSTTNMYVGMPVYAADLSAGTIVTAVGANSLTLNIAATGSNTETVTGGTVTGITNGQTVMIQNAGGVAAVNVNNLTVTAVNTGSNNFTVNTSGACAGTYTSGGWIAYQTLAITGKAGGSRLIVASNGEPISKDNNGNTFIGTGIQGFFYSSVTGHVHWAGPGVGITTSVPPEAQIQLANLVNADLWWGYGNYASDDYITQLGTLALGSLNSNLKFYTEQCNENWNPSFQCTFQLTGLGLGAGLFTNPAFTQSTTPAYQALRTLQVGKLMQAVFIGGNRSRYENLYMFQAGSGFNNTTIANQMNGSSLAILGLGYDSFPNRPIDLTDAIGYAPYTGPTGLLGQSIDVGNTAPSAFDLATLQNIADNYIAGNTATAISAITAQFTQGNRTQTVTASGTTFTTPLAHNFSAGTLLQFTVSGGTAYSGINTLSIYQVDATTSNTFTAKLITNGVIAGSDTNAGIAGSGTMSASAIVNQNATLFGVANAWMAKWQNMAANGFTPAALTAPLKVKHYEGALEVTPPTVAQATAISLVTPSTPATPTGTTHTNAVVDTLSSITGLYAGMAASAADITGSPTISTINSGCPTSCTGNYVVLSGNATGSNTETVTFTGTATLANSTIQSAIVAWKNDPAASAMIQQYYNIFMGLTPGYITFGAMPNSDSPSNLVMLGSSTNIWSLTQSQSPASPSVYKLYCGFGVFSGNPSPGFGC